MILIFSTLWVFIFFVGFVCSICDNPSSTTTSITQYGITWSFSQAIPCGKFFNEDYYVVDTGNGVTVLSVTPTPTPSRHNSMINPTTGIQSYDDRISYFDRSKGVIFPVVVHGNVSLVSTISLENSNCLTNSGENGNKNIDGTCIPYRQGRPQLKTASILTILDKHLPHMEYFRPNYIGDQKYFFSTKQVQKQLLPSLDIPLNTLTINLKLFLENLKRHFKRPWIHHISDWTSRELHPIENMLDYHEKISHVLQKTSVFVLLNESTLNEMNISKYNLINLMIQNGLDYYAMSKNGSGSSAFHRWPIYFCGLLLNSKIIYNSFKNNEIMSMPRTDDKCYYIEEKESTLKSTIVNEGLTWTGHTVAWRQEKWPVDASEHEHLHITEWNRLESEGAYQGGGSKRESYRSCCNSYTYVGMALAAHSMNARKLWSHNAFFDYVDRWMNEDMSTYGFTNGYTTSNNELIDYLWHNNRYKYGCTYINTHKRVKSRIYSCNGIQIDCYYIQNSCNTYPNQEAYNYDPCNIGCIENEYVYNGLYGIEWILTYSIIITFIIFIMISLFCTFIIIILCSFYCINNQNKNIKNN